MILMLDNYDSFTYNLVQYLEILGAHVETVRNDRLSVDEVLALNPRGVVISPGPGRPEDAGISVDLVKACAGKIPLLGVCLGHQSLAVAFGGVIIKAQNLMHGKTSQVTCDGKTIFNKLDKKPFEAMRYHSLAVEKETLPDCFEVSAVSNDGEIMGIRHKEHTLEGIQFHPESIMTPIGKRLLKNFLELLLSV